VNSSIKRKLLSIPFFYRKFIELENLRKENAYLRSGQLDISKNHKFRTVIKRPKLKKMPNMPILHVETTKKTLL